MKARTVILFLNQKEMTNAERHLEKLTNREPEFFYDPHTDGKDLI